MRSASSWSSAKKGTTEAAHRRARPQGLLPGFTWSVCEIPQIDLEKILNCCSRHLRIAEPDGLNRADAFRQQR